jgi:lipopolysaccharide export LptBFGC system permease protein LptF
MSYFLPITLTFVLPMAALFAAALVYGRFACDNELDACRASGISLLTLVYPGLALAIIVAIANLILSFYVMPAFIRRAEKSFKADAKQILFRNIERRGHYELPTGRYRIYADITDPAKDMLGGVVVAELGTKNQRIERIITAESARVRFDTHDIFNEVQITAYNTYQMGTGEQGWFYFKWLPITTEFPSLLGDKIKFKKIDEMKRILLDPLRFYPVAKLARETYSQLIADLLTEDISDKMTVTGSSYRLYSGQKTVRITADRCAARDERRVELSGNVKVVESDADDKKPLRILQSTRAFLLLEGDEMAPTLTMELYSPMWEKSDGSKGLAVGQVRIRGLVLPQTVADKLKAENLLDAVSPGMVSQLLRKRPSAALVNLQGSLDKKIRGIFNEISAEIHSRLVFGMGCIPLIMIGIGLGIIKKGGHLLSAFGVSSVPAAMLIVCIMMGKNVATNGESQAGSGILLMWVGLAVLTALMVFIYRRLLAN